MFTGRCACGSVTKNQVDMVNDTPILFHFDIESNKRMKKTKRAKSGRAMRGSGRSSKNRAHCGKIIMNNGA